MTLIAQVVILMLSHEEERYYHISPLLWKLTGIFDEDSMLAWNWLYLPSFLHVSYNKSKWDFAFTLADGISLSTKLCWLAAFQTRVNISRSKTSCQPWSKLRDREEKLLDLHCNPVLCNVFLCLTIWPRHHFNGMCTGIKPIRCQDDW